MNTGKGNTLMKKYLFALPLAALLLSGCAGSKQEIIADLQAPRAFEKADVDAGKVLAEKYINTLVKAIQSSDFNTLSPYLGTNLVSVRQKRAIFADMCKSLSRNGILKSAEFVACFDQTLCRDYLWKLKFEKVTGKEKLPLLHTEILYNVRIAISDNTPEIVRTRLIYL